MTINKILKPGKNCWQTAHADKVALLIDGENYYGAFHRALQKARHSVYILAWDIDSRMRLVRGDVDTEGWPVELAPFINEVLRRNPKLNIYLLNWDWAMVYTLEREWLPMYKPSWKSQKRLHFKLDGECPVGASQHQKVVVVDDEIAFSGGFDLGKNRWDSSEHSHNDPRRINPDNQAYPAFHDVQMLVSGAAARALGDLARERWLRATGERLSPPPAKSETAWPDYVESWFENVDVGIARTLPDYPPYDEVREVEQLFIDSIPAAKDIIYIENQYFTSWRIAELLADSLQAETGPEIVLVLPRLSGGWLEQMTMDVLRYRVACQLIEADKHKRLRICYLHNDEMTDTLISLHAKITIIDNTLMRVGSANLSNRSMGLDSECDMVIEADDEQQEDKIRAFRERLLSEHLAMEPAELQQALVSAGSVTHLIDKRQDQPRTLKLLDCQVSQMTEDLLPSSAVIDPERPLDPEQMAKMFIPVDEPKAARKQWWKIISVLVAVIALALIWRWTPLSEYLNPETLKTTAEAIESYPLTPLIVVAVFSIAAVLALPVTLLIVTTALTFGPVWGTVYSLLGSVLSALMGYGIGRYMGRNTVQKLSGSSLNRLSRRLAHHGALAVVTVRIIPVAPFALINLVAGASHIKTRDFILGTVLGMLPGILGITVFADSLLKTVKDPEPAQIGLFVVVVLVILSIMYGLKILLNRKQVREESDTP